MPDAAPSRYGTSGFVMSKWIVRAVRGVAPGGWHRRGLFYVRADARPQAVAKARRGSGPGIWGRTSAWWSMPAVA